MGNQNLNKNLKEIFNHQYIVPLYQRNYAWAEDEIAQLLQDLYENFKKFEINQNLNYFIGSLVVLKRKDDFYEVIDGQQRLTTLSILLKILGLVESSKLFYESRPEVETFFDSYYKNVKTQDMAFNHKVSHLINAVDLLNNTFINPDEKTEKRLSEISRPDLFKKFVFENVILVLVEIPQETDVASYFEIMNNRGEQLKKHEILKSYLMDTLKDEDGNYFPKQQDEFSRIWDACSQMDTHIQKLFSSGDRQKYFGKNYDEIYPVDFLEDEGEVLITSGFSINDALKRPAEKTDSFHINDIDDAGEDHSIIDFPNFLMHIFKIKYNTYSYDGNETEIPLNEKDLLTVYSGLKAKIEAKDFISDLLYYRTVFDRFIIKSSEDGSLEDNYRWSLQKPYKNSEGTLVYRNVFESDYQKRLIKSISLLQVTFRNRKYKNWLQDILFLFSDKENFRLSSIEYQEVIDQFIISYFEKNISESSYDQGVKVPHFLFNFIDYLYWVQSPVQFDFKFTYRNSVEHHLSQSLNNPVQDNLGNLCLVSKSSNSRMNNESPVGKADSSSAGKYYKNGKIPPKQKRMYDLTNLNKKWEDHEIAEHKLEVIQLLNARVDILSLQAD
ncbi:DUF262 domain-containing protein [Chryseobacterium sp. JV558]|uniref:DUF262 domain-containing protein n=1 Tax=Chryseobacterium sp. JV558 TaxID=2663236 RepID=UPI00299DB9C2|nr:DUF262 domain-containing protein [Chryseobacterium sp. JV558]MDW9380681.1 DUF262 domain-containing protein [Chryseobacterium sp. JV558]